MTGAGSALALAVTGMGVTSIALLGSVVFVFMAWSVISAFRNPELVTQSELRLFRGRLAWAALILSLLGLCALLLLVRVLEMEKSIESIKYSISRMEKEKTSTTANVSTSEQLSNEQFLPMANDDNSRLE